MKKITKILLVVMMLTAFVSFPLKSQAAVGSVDLGDVVQMGDFEGSTHYIVFYPKALETSGDTAWPVAVWANGTMCAPALYTNLLKGVAAKGYIVVASSEMMSANGSGQIAAIDYIVNQSMDEKSVFCGKIDPGKIAAFGHSQGGRSSVNAAASDARIGCVVSIAGSSYTSEAQQLSAPALFLTGTKDVVVLSSLWVEPAYKSVTGPAVYASLKNGIHTTCILDSDKYIDYCAGWFDAWLRNDADAMGQFKPGGALSKDGGWTKFASKNLTDNGITGSVFSGGTLWKAIALVELLVIIAGAAVILARRKGQKSPA